MWLRRLVFFNCVCRCVKNFKCICIHVVFQSFHSYIFPILSQLADLVHTLFEHLGPGYLPYFDNIVMTLTEMLVSYPKILF